MWDHIAADFKAKRALEEAEEARVKALERKAFEEKNEKLQQEIAAVVRKARQDGESLASQVYAARNTQDADATKIGNARKNSIPSGASSDERTATRSTIDLNFWGPCFLSLHTVETH